jgi:hypothetical protein
VYAISKNTSSIVLPLIGLKNLLGHCNSTTTMEHYLLLCKSSRFRQRKVLPLSAPQPRATHRTKTRFQTQETKSTGYFSLSKNSVQSFRRYQAVKIQASDLDYFIFSYMDSWPKIIMR